MPKGAAIGNKNALGNKGGGVTKYLPEYCERVIAMGKQGLTFAQMAQELDIERNNMRHWTEVHPEFRIALTRAEEFCENWWVQFAKDNLITSRAVTFNDRAWMNVMMNKFNWNKKEETTLKGDLADAMQLMAERKAKSKNPPV